MKIRDAKSLQRLALHPFGPRFAPLRPVCSLLTLISLGVLCIAGDAQAAGPLPAGTVPTRNNYLGGSGVRDITTVNTGNGNQWTTIWQNQRAAIANFNKFNIAAGSGVTVDQADSGYRLLARVTDPGLNPTIIQGALQGKGQVILLNRNGILFDKDSQINVGSLIASTLNIRDADFEKGFNSSATGSSAAPFTRFDLFTDPQTGQRLPSAAVQVAAGANLNASSTGAIVLIAPAIENNGVITAPDGQVILAAGKTVYLWQRNPDAGYANSGSIRGLMVEITAGDQSVNLSSLVANSVTNTGTLSADRGNVSIAALAINQNGIVSAGSSVVSNGSIWLAARSITNQTGTSLLADDDGGTNRSVSQLGTVSFGAGSFTGTPLLDDSGRLSRSDSYSAFQSTAANGSTSTRDFRSWIHIVGNKIDNKGTILAPGGVIDVLAQGTNGRVLLESGSVLSAAGNWVDRLMSDNIIDITRLTSNELKDAPLQRSGSLLGAAVSFDARKGSTLFDTSGYIANQQESVKDKAIVGGKITIQALQGDVIALAGSTIDVSGGGYRYAGGTLGTTKLIGEDGKIYDIGSASPLRKYVGTVDGLTRAYVKAGPMGWNQFQTFATRYKTQPAYESGYVQGASAGSLMIAAPSIVRQGDWLGGVTLGRYQVNQASAGNVPQAGTLTIGERTISQTYQTNTIAFGDAPDLPASFNLGTALPASVLGNLTLPEDEFGFAGYSPETYAYTGFGTLALYANRSITVPAGVEVTLPPGGTFGATTTRSGSESITLEGSHDGLAAGKILAPAGKVNFYSNNVNLGDGAAVDVSGVVMAEGRAASGLPAAGGFTAKPGNSVADYLVKNVGALLDDMAGGQSRPAGSVAAPRYAIDAAGASISVDSQSLNLGEESRLSAMGGFVLGADNTITAGNGGTITLPFSGGSNTAGPNVNPVGTNFYGYSLGKGGTLEISADSVRIGDGLTGSALLAGQGNTANLLVDPAFFRNGGFTSFALSAGLTLDIAAGTHIDLAARGLQVKLAALTPRPGASSRATGVDPASAGDAGVAMTVASSTGTIAADLTVREKLAGERTATNVSFAVNGGSALTFGHGAEIRTDPGATVSFGGSGFSYGGSMDLLGRVFAPGGSINVSLSTVTLNNSDSRFNPANPDAETQSALLHVGSDAVLSTAGTFVRQVGGSNAFGLVTTDAGVTLAERRQGYVTSGGSISMTATRSRLLTDAGSLLDVSGVGATVDAPTGLGNLPYAPQQIWSDGGKIALSSTEATRLDGSLLGSASGAGLGGTFSLSFKRRDFVDPLGLPRQDFGHRVVVTQGVPDASQRYTAGGTPLVTARISADTINAAGFSSVTLAGSNSVEFSGPVQLATSQELSINAPLIDVVRPANSAVQPLVSLATNHLTLMNAWGNDQSLSAPDAYAPATSLATRVAGGVLRGDARLIDLAGSMTVNGLATGIDPATGQDARGLVLNSTGDIRLTGLPVRIGSNASQAPAILAGGLRTEGNIELAAQQVYGTTLSQFTLASQRVIADGQAATNSGTIRIEQAAGTPQPVLSAGAGVTFKADRIIQAGTVKAPQGSIEFDGRDVSFAAGSVTSVSLAGQTVPLGETLNGRSWFYELDPKYATGVTVASPGAKQIVVNGSTVSVAPGATIDLAGGGDVQAFEFVAGPGGSKDVLQTSSASPTWAILPSMRLADTPLDTHLAARNGNAVTSYDKYNTIYISGVAGIADGYYPLLNAHYALLPGAYQVSALTAANKGQLAGTAATAFQKQLDGKFLDQPLGKLGTLLDGKTVISAWRGVSGSGAHEARTSAYVVQPGSAAQQQSQFNLTGSEFFASQAAAAGTSAPRLAKDAGGLTLRPTDTLVLQGKILGQPAAGGTAAEIDITADLLAVVKNPGSAATEQALAAELGGLGAGARFVEVDVASLNGLEGSVLIGGSRTGGGKLSTDATRVVVNNDASSPLRAAEIMLAATDKIAVLGNSVISGDVAGSSARTSYTTQRGAGALLRASSDGQLTLDRTDTPKANASTTAAGALDIRSGATVTGNSILADATGNTSILGSLQVGTVRNGVRSGGSLGLAASSVALGETAGWNTIGTLTLDNTQLAALNTLDALSIRSYSSLALVGSAAVGSASLKSLTLDAAELAGFKNVSGATNQATIAAGTFAFRNGSGSSLSSTAPNGTGTLDVSADRIVIGAGDKGIRGFSQVSLGASTEIVQSGKGTTTVAATTRLETPRLVGATAADQTLRAATYTGVDGNGKIAAQTYLPLAVASSTAVALSQAQTAATAGGRWTFEGKSVNLATRIDAPAGKVSIAALGQGSGDDVALDAGAVVNVSGFRKQFTDASAFASAGTVELTSDHGDVRMASGASVDLSANSGGGDAGKLVVSAIAGLADLAGTVFGTADSGTSGSVSVDAGGITDFSGLNQRLNVGGVTGERVFRQRSGNVSVAGGSTVKASHVSISADAGDINVDGTVDASGANGGGRVELYAKNNLSLNTGSRIDASGTGSGTQATDPYANGGQVELVAESGRLDFAAGAQVDISSGAKGDAGRVTFASARDAAGGWVNAPTLAGTVKATHAANGAPGKIVVRGDRRYSFANDFDNGFDANAVNNDPATDANFKATSVYSDYVAFANNASNLASAALNSRNLVLSPGDSQASVVSAAAGIELTGNQMNLQSALDLTGRPGNGNWMVNGVAGMFSLRAAGTLTIGNSIGLADYSGWTMDGNAVTLDWLPRGDSWSLRLVGGADLNAANPLAVANAATLNGGDVVLQDNGAGTGKVRTGSGNIEIAAGRNVSFEGNQAVIYSAGVAQDLATDPYARYTSGGGDVRVFAQGDIVGALKPTSQAASATGEFVNDWLRRTTTILGLNNLSTGSWWAWRPRFREGIASFGGGNIAVEAQGSISNLGVMAPSSGRSNVEVDAYTTPTVTPLVVRGGGDIRVAAGKDIVGGEFLVGLGKGSVRAEGAIGTTSARTALFLMGLGSDSARNSATLRLEAGGDVLVQNISNPTMLALPGPVSNGFAVTDANGVDLQLPEVGYNDLRAGFFTYSPSTRAEVVSVGGNIDLGRTIAIKPGENSPQNKVPTTWSSVAPPQLVLAALSGDLLQQTSSDAVNNLPVDLYPSAAGELQLLAGGNIANVGIRDWNLDPSRFPSWSQPGSAIEGQAPVGANSIASLLGYTVSGARLAALDASTGPRFVVEAERGDVTGATLITPGATSVRAGRDIRGSVIDIQNLDANDVSTVAAGRDIVQDVRYYRGDRTVNNGANTALMVGFAGPGAGVVEAGRNIDLADSKGIFADGNTRNASINNNASTRLIVLAGVTGPIDIGGIDALMSATKLFGLMGDASSAAMARSAQGSIAAANSANAASLDALDANLSSLAISGSTKDVRAAASAAHDALANARKAVASGSPVAVLDTLISGLKDMSVVDTANGNAVNSTSAAAVKAMAAAIFAGNDVGPGDINLFKTMIQTTGGSQIDLLAPGFDSSGKPAGNINAGLPSGSSGNVGVVTQAGGAINTFVSGDFNVNQSKVLTQQGGDIVLYSSDGSIDAGRGALTSRSSSPPRKVALYDPTTGEFIGFVFLPPIDVSGSGIRTVSSDPDGPGPLTAPKPGSVYLFAPKGTINAGEAGIASAGDVTLRAVQVLNANAISAAGSSSGVPQTAAAPVGNLGPTANTGPKSDDMAKNLAPPSFGEKESVRPRILLVEVLGFSADEDGKKDGKKSVN
jgi:filamentous hemagglutinin family protein